MEYRELGKTGLNVSALGYGAWGSSDQSADNVKSPTSKWSDSSFPRTSVDAARTANSVPAKT